MNQIETRIYGLSTKLETLRKELIQIRERLDLLEEQINAVSAR